MDPKQGKICIDDQNLTDLNLSFREHLSLCPQVQYFFNDSIINNVRISNPQKYFHEVCGIKDQSIMEIFSEFEIANKEIEPEIVEMFKHFDLYSKVMELKENFEFVIGENGSMLSGGERQRLSLIRTFLKPAKIYIFDEPTNFLDNIHFNRFMEICQKYVDQGKTVIVISHELSLAEKMDNVVCFLESGDFEYGTHQELIGKDTHYGDIWAKMHI